MIKCMICNKEFKSYNGLSSHISQIHNIKAQKYYDRYFRNYSCNEGFCLECGKETNFWNLAKGYRLFCSQKCNQNSTKTKNKKIRTSIKHFGTKYPWQTKVIRKKLERTCLEKYGVKNTFQSKKSIKNRLKKLNIKTKNNLPLFEYHKSKIGWVDKIRRSLIDKDILEVKCKKCNKWFIPKISDLNNRIAALNGKKKFAQYNLYCSESCKNLCSIYKQHLYQRNQNPNSERPWHSEWSQEVKRIANYECEICGSKNDLTAHHIQPVKLRPDLQADIDNGICLCRNCHSKYGHKDECSTGNLAKVVC